ncbi:MAG TPA: IclR family transcriptional regulator [Deferrisomatales bacterium]|nr:IclR family transcriptional regulator [Deferrisomatales bacterium]
MTKQEASFRGGGGVSRYNIRAVERAMGVLNLFSRQDHKLSLDEITRRSGLSKPTVFRILSTLECHNYVVLDPTDGRYRLGTIFLTLGGAVLASLSLRGIASQHLTRLREELQVTVVLGALIDDALVYLDKKEASGPVRIASDIGWRRDPPHFGMLGMAQLAFKDEEEVRHDLEHVPLIAHTQHSLTDPEAFLQRLRKIREDGYVVELNEAIEGVWGVAAPIWDAREEVVAAVGVGQSMTAHTQKREGETIARVLLCARAISAELGYRPAGAALT